MGFKSLVLILIISTISMSCSAVNYSTQPNSSERDYELFNNLGSKNSSRIYLLSDEEISTKYVFAKNDSLYYATLQDTLSIPIADIERVKNKNWKSAGGNGLVFGLATTLVSGGLMIASSPEESESIGLGLVIVGLAVLSGLTVFILGVTYGGETEFIFNEKVNYEQIDYHTKKKPTEIQQICKFTQ